MSDVVTTETVDAKEFENRIPLTAQAALFNPIPDVRERKLRELRAQSPFGPDTWEELDEATGVKPSGPTAELTADSTLEVDSWAEYADMVLDDQFVESTVIDQLIGAGFGVSASLSRYAYFNPLSNTRLEAETSMNLRTQSEQDLPAHGLDGVPLPLSIVTYSFDAREYQNAQAFGESLDTSVGREARRALNREEMDVFWNGWGNNIETERGTLAVDGLDHNITEILSASSSNGWIGDAAEILSDVDTLHDTIEDQTNVDDTDDVPLVSEVGAHWFVPRGMWGEVSRLNYEPSSGATDEPVLDRIERKYPYLNIHPSPRLDDDHTILMLDDPRYFQVVNAQGVTNTSWEAEGGASLNNRVLSSRVPFVRTQPDGIAGITRMTGIDA